MRNSSTTPIRMLFIFGGVCLAFILQATGKGAGSVLTANAESSVETLQLTSQVFDNTRSIRVLLPPGYHDPENAGQRYPVFYFTDGILVFRSNRINMESPSVLAWPGRDCGIARSVRLTDISGSFASF